MGICLCICITVIIVALIIAGCYYLEYLQNVNEDVVMELRDKICVLECKMDQIYSGGN